MSVQAKRSAMASNVKLIEQAAQALVKQGVKEFQISLSAYRSTIQAQAKENEDALARMNAGIKGLGEEINKLREDCSKYIHRFHFG